MLNLPSSPDMSLRVERSEQIRPYPRLNTVARRRKVIRGARLPNLLMMNGTAQQGTCQPEGRHCNTCLSTSELAPARWDVVMLSPSPMWEVFWTWP